MSTQNKRNITRFGVDLDFLYTGAVVRISFHEDDEYHEYLITVNRRALMVKRFIRGAWDVIIPADYTNNPLSVTKEEVFMVSILPGLSLFERKLYEMTSVVARMWHNEADEKYAESYILSFLKENLF